MHDLFSNKLCEFTAKDSFHFAEQIVDQQHDLFMGSLDVDSLFLKSSLVQISMVSSKGMLLNRESTSKLTIQRSCC